MPLNDAQIDGSLIYNRSSAGQGCVGPQDYMGGECTNLPIRGTT